jgi:hypothetical protein
LNTDTYSKDRQLPKRLLFVRDQRCGCGERLKVKINVLLYLESNRCTRLFVKQNIKDIPKSFI